MADIQVTQIQIEVLTASGLSAAVGVVGDGLITQFVAEYLVSDAVSTLTATLQHIVSGTSVVNVVGVASLVVSSEWVTNGGNAPFTYSWVFADIENEAGFSTLDAGSAITRTYVNAGGGNLGRRRASSTIIDAAGLSFTSAYQAHIAGVAFPNQFDGIFQRENQPTRRVWPI